MSIDSSDAAGNLRVPDVLAPKAAPHSRACLSLISPRMWHSGGWTQPSSCFHRADFHETKGSPSMFFSGSSAVRIGCSPLIVRGVTGLLAGRWCGWGCRGVAGGKKGLYRVSGEYLQGPSSSNSSFRCPPAANSCCLVTVHVP